MRTDVHAPKNFDPADYEIIDFVDSKRPEPPLPQYATAKGVELWEKAVRAWEARIQEHFPNFRTGGDDHKSIRQCNHCGAHIRWVAVALHKPTGKHLAFGEICADRVEIPTRDAFRAKFIKDRAALEAARLENELRRAAFREQAGDVVDYLTKIDETGRNEFLNSLARQLETKGELSEKQIEAVRRNIQRDAEFAAKREAQKAALANSPALTAERRDIVGKVITTKWQSSDYGDTLKMLVEEQNGNRLWGTCPEALQSKTMRRDHYDAQGKWVDVDPEIAELKGTVVGFTATITPSKDDEHFGFYKRPTGSRIIETTEEVS